MKRSSSVEASNLGNGTETARGMTAADGSNWNNVLSQTANLPDGINSDKSIDSGRSSLA